jgi:hypothetical protein
MIFDFHEAAAIAAAIAGFSDACTSLRLSDTVIEALSRKTQTGCLAKIFDRVAGI